MYSTLRLCSVRMILPYLHVPAVLAGGRFMWVESESFDTALQKYPQSVAILLHGQEGCLQEHIPFIQVIKFEHTVVWKLKLIRVKKLLHLITIINRKLFNAMG